MFVSDSDIGPPSDLHIRLSVAAQFSMQVGHWNLANLRASHWRVYVVNTLGAWIATPDGEFPLVPGKLYVVPAGVTFSGRNDSPFTQSFIHFDVVGIPHYTALDLFSRPVELDDPGGLCDRIAAVCRGRSMSQRIDILTQIEAKGAVYQSLGLFLAIQPDHVHERYWSIAAAVEPVLPALEFIERNLSGDLLNRKLAELCHMSEGHFLRRFRQCMKVTPGQYAHERRISLASQMLIFTSNTIEQIANDCGFGSRYYFTRIFTRHAGIGPAAYRQSVKR